MSDSVNAGEPREGAADGADFKAATDLVRELAEVLRETGLRRVDVAVGSMALRVEAHAATGEPAPSPAIAVTAAPVPPPPDPAPADPPPAAAPAAAAEGVPVISPMAGICHLRPKPDESPYVSAGVRVQAGQPVAIVEAMKTYTEVLAPRGGVVSSILVDDGTVVEFDQILFTLDPS